MLQPLAIWLQVWASTHIPILPLRSTPHPFQQAGGAVLGRGSSPASPEPQQPRTLRELVLCRLSQSETSTQDSACAPRPGSSKLRWSQQEEPGVLPQSRLGHGASPSPVFGKRWTEGWKDGRTDGERWMEGGNETGDSESSGELPAEQRQSFA